MAYSLTKEKKKMLEESINMFSRMISACKEIQQGNSIIDTMKKHNIDQNTFRRVVFNKKLGFKYESPNELYLEDRKINLKFLSWYERLFCKMTCTTNIKEVPPDLDKTLSYCFTMFLSSPESLVLTYKYKDELSVKEIASKFGLSNKRIYQIESEAIRKLTHIKPLNIMIYGIEEGSKMNEELYSDIESIRKTI